MVAKSDSSKNLEIIRQQFLRARCASSHIKAKNDQMKTNLQTLFSACANSATSSCIISALQKHDIRQQKRSYERASIQLQCHPLHYSKTSTGYPLNGEYISNWPPWHIRHCTLASHLTCPNCYNIMNPHGLCDLPFLFNSLFHDTTLNSACVHFKCQHQKPGVYCLLVSVILHHSLHFVGI